MSAPALSPQLAARLHFIECLLVHYGTFQPKALADYFGLGSAQASRDVAQYLTLAPGNAVYDKAARTYIKGAAFVPLWP